MTKLSEKIFLGFDKDVGLESLRQWLVMLSLIGLWIMYVLNTYQLFKIYESINFEVIIMSSSILRLILLFFYEFLLPDEFIIFLSMWLHTIIMLIVFYKLAVAVFDIANIDDMKKKFLWPYVAITLIMLLITIIHSLAAGNALSWKSHSFSIHWYINSIVSIGNVFLGFFLLKILNNQQRYYGSIVSNADLLYKNQYNTIKLQMHILIWNSLIFSILEIVLIIIGASTYKNHLKCISNRFFIPNSSGGALYLIVRSTILIGPTVGLWLVTYFAPSRQRKVITMLNSDNTLNERLRLNEEREPDYFSDHGDGNSIILSTNENEKDFEDNFLNYAMKNKTSMRNKSPFRDSDVIKNGRSSVEDAQVRSNRGSL